MDIDNRSIQSMNYHTLTIVTPVAHKIPGMQAISGGDLVAGNGEASITSDGYYDGSTYNTKDKVLLDMGQRSGYYRLTASGNGTVERTAITKQVTKEGFFPVDDEPVEEIELASLQSETAQTAYYIKKSVLSADYVEPDTATRTITVGEGYYPTQRAITIAPVVASYPVTSLTTQNFATYFYASNVKDYDVKIVPQYSNTSGYVIAHTNVNSGGISYYNIKKTQITKGITTIDGAKVTRGIVSCGTGWIEANEISAATFKNTETSGVEYVDISDTTEAPVLQSGDFLYIDEGYVDNIKISLAKLVPDAGSAAIAADYILTGYSAYNNDGVLISGNIQTYDGSYTIA